MSYSVRKVIRVGKSNAIVIPPHVLDHIRAERGDFVIWDISTKNFAFLSLAPIPPYGGPISRNDESPSRESPEGQTDPTVQSPDLANACERATAYRDDVDRS